MREEIAERYGKNHPVLDAIDNLARKPNSPARRKVLEEEIQAAGIDQDPRLLFIAEQMLKND